jgi:uncharacterized protein YciI
MAETVPYLYRLTLRSEMLGHPRSLAEQETLKRHLAYLTAARDHGIVIAAGRTEASESATFGIVLFRAASEVEARSFMANDPAVAGKVMNAELHPFRLAVPPKHWPPE